MYIFLCLHHSGRKGAPWQCSHWTQRESLKDDVFEEVSLKSSRIFVLVCFFMYSYIHVSPTGWVTIAVVTCVCARTPQNHTHAQTRPPSPQCCFFCPCSRRKKKNPSESHRSYPPVPTQGDESHVHILSLFCQARTQSLRVEVSVESTFISPSLSQYAASFSPAGREQKGLRARLCPVVVGLCEQAGTRWPLPSH